MQTSRLSSLIYCERGIQICGVICLVIWCHGLGVAQDEAAGDCVRAVAQGLELPEAQIELEALQTLAASPDHGGRAVHSCRCRVRSGGGTTVGWVSAEVAAAGGQLCSLQWLTQERHVVQETIEEFAAAHLPQWSDAMMLVSEIFTEHGTAEFLWRERREDAWTGTRFFALVHLDQPGRPYLFGSYIGTPRAMDAVAVTREQAVQVGEQFLRGRGYVPEMLSADLYLDDAEHPLPHWYLCFGVRREGAEQETPTNILIDAVTGTVLWPPGDDE